MPGTRRRTSPGKAATRRPRPRRRQTRQRASHAHAAGLGRGRVVPRIRSDPGLAPSRALVRVAAVVRAVVVAARAEVAAGVAVARQVGVVVDLGLEWPVRTQRGLVQDHPVRDLVLLALDQDRLVRKRDHPGPSPARHDLSRDHVPALDHRTPADQVLGPGVEVVRAIQINIKVIVTF